MQNKAKNKGIITVMFIIIMSNFSYGEITHSVINLTYEGNLEGNAKDVEITAEMPLIDETQTIKKIYSNEKFEIKNNSIKIYPKDGKYSLSFILEKKYFEIKFGDEFGNESLISEIDENTIWNDEIKNLTEDITKDISYEDKNIEKAMKVLRIMKFVHDNIVYDPNSKFLSAKDVFKFKKATCMGYTNLFISMCKSINIPARAVGGIAFNGKNFEEHAYAEVFIGEWIPVDPTFMQFPADASHIAIYKGNSARNITIELKFSGKISYNGSIDAGFINVSNEDLIDAKIYNRNLTGRNSIMPVNVEIKNKKKFYVSGICKIFSNLKSDDKEKLFLLQPQGQQNLSFNIFVPELNESFLYVYPLMVKCNDINLSTNFTVDTDIEGNVYDGVIIENINVSSKEIYLKNLNEENENDVNVSIIINNVSENKSVVIEKGGKYVLKYNIEYPEGNFTIFVKCYNKNFSVSKKIPVNVRAYKSDKTYDKFNFFNKNFENFLYAFLGVIFLLIIFSYYKFKKR